MAWWRPIKLWRVRSGSGTGSLMPLGSERRSASSTHRLISRVWSPALPDWGYTGTMRPVSSPTRSTMGLVIWFWPR